MAITRTEIKVTHSAANTVAITTASNATSDLTTRDPTCIDASITVKVSSAGSPIVAGTVDVYALLASGDPDGAAAGDEFDTADTTHARYLGTLDTTVTDPAIKTFPLPTTPQAQKIYMVNNGTGTATCGAVIEETRSA